jgi:hypothetical protein
MLSFEPFRRHARPDSSTRAQLGPHLIAHYASSDPNELNDNKVEPFFLSHFETFET